VIHGVVTESVPFAMANQARTLAPLCKLGIRVR
jgi:hypothetical protein